MFMVEANEAVARLLAAKGRAFLRRIHPDPAAGDTKDLTTFLRACGRKLAPDMTRKDVQALLEAVRGRPEEYAVNLAVLRTFQQAEYSPRPVGHFALASDCYCHFTSPIRRYPDLTVHRLIAEHCRGTLDRRPPEDMSALTKLGEDCSAAARRAEAAERECREVLVLELLATKVGEGFQGVITGVANFGIFVQSPRYLVEGLIRMPDLGDDWWEVDAKRGEVRGERSGRRFRIGDMLAVRIAGVDKARRQLNLVPDRDLAPAKPPHAPHGKKDKKHAARASSANQRGLPGPAGAGKKLASSSAKGQPSQPQPQPAKGGPTGATRKGRGDHRNRNRKKRRR
jgi:ribonuclease R